MPWILMTILLVVAALNYERELQIHTNLANLYTYSNIQI